MLPRHPYKGVRIMNYGRREVEKKLQNRSAKKVEEKAGMSLVWMLLVAIFALTIGGICCTYGILQGLVESAPDISSLSTAPAESATYVCDADGNPVQKLTAPTSNRIPVSLDQVPYHLQNAIVAIEDERFYEHNGIDVRGIIRAFVVGITGGSFSEGASTITQQLLKNSVFPDWVNETSLVQSFKRKFQEQYLAVQLEQNLEKTRTKEEAKHQILEDYLNTINLGAGTYGVQAAAQRYFNKDVSELSLSECAVIAGITQNPTGYNPILHPEANDARRMDVLAKMQEQHYISPGEYANAVKDPVYDRIRETDVQTGAKEVYSYYTDALIEQVLEDLVQKAGYTNTQASRALYSGGLRIYSAQDAAIQQICDEEFANPANFPADTLVGLDYALSLQKADGTTAHYGNADFQAFLATIDPSLGMMFADEETAKSYARQFSEAMTGAGDQVLGERISFVMQPQASAVIIEQATGYVKAVVGGRGEKEASLTLNRATSSRRQPGSTFKPLAAYAPAIDHNGKTLASVYDNAPYSYASGAELKNWDSAFGYSGLETIHFALVKSINVVAVKCLTEITPQVGLEYLEKFGITTLYGGETDAAGNVLSDAYQPLALGGITDGVVNLELTAAYAALANGGTYIAPKFYTRIEDSKGNVLLENLPAGREVVKPSTAYLLTTAMQDVIRHPDGTAYGQIQLGDMPVAGKTGTTDQTKDIWFEGYTPYYTCGIWGGYDDNEALPSYDASFSNYAKTLWNSIMCRVHEDLPVVSFAQPSDTVTAVVCKKSGKLAVQGLCTADPRGSQAYAEYFSAGTVPTKTCDAHVLVSVCSVTGQKATDACPSATRVCLARPEGSSWATDDSAYAAPTATCQLHQGAEASSDLGLGDGILIIDGEDSGNASSGNGQNPADTLPGAQDPFGNGGGLGTTDPFANGGGLETTDPFGASGGTFGGNSFEDIPADSYYNDGTVIIY